ncbi:MAG: ABC-F family ATP-binding cassette domain-containing protein [Clostridia bacterium]|nr:ABC-F family ATP-binding cassette domain-containing protein [Clostridia bacterium]
MMPLLSAHHLTKYFGDRLLFRDVSFDVEERSRIGFVGANGTGKTTLFHMLTGEMAPDDGQVVKMKTTRIGYMQQHTSTDSSVTLYEDVLRVFAPLIAMERELESVHAALESSYYEGDSALIEKQSRLQERFEAEGGLYFRGRVRSALLGLGFSEQDLDRTMDTFSGGQRSKAAMARLLLSDSNLLLLDEPTNHLDIASVEWLEGFLSEYRGALIVISHDRYFLDRVTNRTMELSNGRLVVTNGNYSAHKEKREQDKEIEQKHYVQAQREIKRIEDNIALLKQWNREKSIRAAESREKRVERLKAELVIPEAELDTIRFRFTAEKVSGQDVIEGGELSKSFGEKNLFKNVDLHIKKGERVFLYGPNGCGKTTLLKIVNGMLPADRGFVRLGANVSVGYYDQTQSGLSDDKMAIDELWDTYPHMTQTEIRSAMAAFLFRGDDVFKPVSLLSGGERARLLLLKLMLAGDNVLLLDEPTNHLDIASCEALEEALSGYDGTMLIVSHDRYFINRMAQRMLWLKQDGAASVIGGYDALCERMKRDLPSATDSTVKHQEAPAKESGGLKRDQLAQRRKLSAQLRQIEQQITQNEEEVERAKAELASPEIAADYERVIALSAVVEEKEEVLLELMETWETLQTQIEELS